MNIIVVICLFDRHENLRRWAHSWSFCDKEDSNLYIINNNYPGLDFEFWHSYCEKRNIKYFQRENIGYETGVIQDIFLGKIGGSWDYLIFVTDDTLPMKKDFIKQYVSKAINPKTGLVYMEDSNVVAPHIRTTGFCISRETADKITFPRNNSKVISKGDCYHFEHTGGEEILMKQIINMNKENVKIAYLEESPLWDTHNTKLNRWEEWHTNFPNFNG